MFETGGGEVEKGEGGRWKMKSVGAPSGTERRACGQQPIGDSGGEDGAGVVGDRSRGLTGAPAHDREGKTGHIQLPTPLLSPGRGADTEDSRVRRDGGTSVKAATTSADGEGGESLGEKIEGGKGEGGEGRGGGIDAWEADDIIPKSAARDMLPCSPPRLVGDDGSRPARPPASTGGSGGNGEVVGAGVCDVRGVRGGSRGRDNRVNDDAHSRCRSPGGDRSFAKSS